MKPKPLIWLLFAVLSGQFATLALAQSSEVSEAAETSVADASRSPKNGSPALTGIRRPPYRLRKSDVLEVRFTFSPEFDQTLAIQPDGFISLKSVGSILAEGMTIHELQGMIAKAYQATVAKREFVNISCGTTLHGNWRVSPLK